jgi:hypothetical protein
MAKKSASNSKNTQTGGKPICAITVKDILDEQIAYKLTWRKGGQDGEKNE